MTQLDLIFYFLKLGATGYGGPLAIISQMQKDLIEEKKLMSKEDFISGFSLIKTLPGPIAIQTVAFVAQKVFNTKVALICAVIFVLPATLVMLLIAVFYDHFKSIHGLNHMMEGLQSGAFLLIIYGLHALTKDFQKKSLFWIYAIFSFFLIAALQVSEPVVILFSGLLVVLHTKYFNAFKNKELKTVMLIEIIWVCLKAGGLAFGTGLAIIPMLQEDFVHLHHWVSKTELLDAIAFGQMTPGPISVTVTFLGYKMAGFSGAVLATIAIFFPGVFNMTTWFPRAFNWYANQKWVSSFSIGATAAVAAGIAYAIYHIFEALVVPSLIFPSILFLLSIKLKLPPWLIVLGGGLFWYLWSFV